MTTWDKLGLKFNQGLSDSGERKCKMKCREQRHDNTPACPVRRPFASHAVRLFHPSARPTPTAVCAPEAACVSWRAALPMRRNIWAHTQHSIDTEWRRKGMTTSKPTEVKLHDNIAFPFHQFVHMRNGAGCVIIVE